MNNACQTDETSLFISLFERIDFAVSSHGDEQLMLLDDSHSDADAGVLPDDLLAASPV